MKRLVLFAVRQFVTIAHMGQLRCHAVNVWISANRLVFVFQEQDEEGDDDDDEEGDFDTKVSMDWFTFYPTW